MTEAEVGVRPEETRSIRNRIMLIIPPPPPVDTKGLGGIHPGGVGHLSTISGRKRAARPIQLIMCVERAPRGQASTRFP